MRLSTQQQILTKNIAKLIIYADSVGIGLTLGEGYRTRSQILLNYFGYKVEKGGVFGIKLVKSRRLSKTLRSLHGSRLAIDFFHFINGSLVYDFDELKILGDYWVGLHPANVWGGDFNKNGIKDKDEFYDAPHYQMNRI